MAGLAEKPQDSSEPLLLESGLAADRLPPRGRNVLFVLEPRTVHLALLLFAGIGLFGIGVVVGRRATPDATQAPILSRPGAGLVWSKSPVGMHITTRKINNDFEYRR